MSDSLDGDWRQAVPVMRERGAAIVARAEALSAARAPASGDGSTTDLASHLRQLAEAVSVQQPDLFAQYVSWVRTMVGRRGVAVDVLARDLECLREALRDHVPSEVSRAADRLLTQALEDMATATGLPPSEFTPDSPYDDIAREYLSLLLRAERHRAASLILDAARQGTPVRDIYLHVFQKTQHEVGRLWQLNELSVAQEHYCTAATQLIMSQLYPYVFQGERNGGRFMGTCVSGDLHEIGVRMVADFFEMAGWDTYYVGASVPVDDVVRALVERKADVLGISATMTYHLHAVEALIAAVRACADTAQVKILVGGYPFNRAATLWQTVGADGSAADADGAIALAHRLTGTAAAS